VSYQLNQAADVKLRLYDITGRLVLDCVDELKNAGEYEYNLNAHGLASGSYFLRLDIGDKPFVEKLTLIK